MYQSTPRTRRSTFKAILVLVFCTFLIGRAVFPMVFSAIPTKTRIGSSSVPTLQDKKPIVEFEETSQVTEEVSGDQSPRLNQSTTCNNEAVYEITKPETLSSDETKPQERNVSPGEPFKSILETIDYLKVADTASRLRIYLLSLILCNLVLLKRRNLILAFSCSLFICFYVAQSPVDVISGVSFLALSIGLLLHR